MKRTITWGWPITAAPAKVQPTRNSKTPVRPLAAESAGKNWKKVGDTSCSPVQADCQPPTVNTAVVSITVIATIITTDWAASVHTEARRPPEKP